MFVDQFLRLLVLLGVHQFLNLIIVLMSLRIIVIVRASGPESRLIERHALVVSPSEHVTAHISVTDKEAVQPDIPCRLVIP